MKSIPRLNNIAINFSAFCPPAPTLVSWGAEHEESEALILSVECQHQAGGHTGTDLGRRKKVRVACRVIIRAL